MSRRGSTECQCHVAEQKRVSSYDLDIDTKWRAPTIGVLSEVLRVVRLSGVIHLRADFTQRTLKGSSNNFEGFVEFAGAVPSYR
jgi:hypothetical protein